MPGRRLRAASKRLMPSCRPAACGLAASSNGSPAATRQRTTWRAVPGRCRWRWPLHAGWPDLLPVLPPAFVPALILAGRRFSWSIGADGFTRRPCCRGWAIRGSSSWLVRPMTTMKSGRSIRHFGVVAWQPWWPGHAAWRAAQPGAAADRQLCRSVAGMETHDRSHHGRPRCAAGNSRHGRVVVLASSYDQPRQHASPHGPRQESPSPRCQVAHSSSGGYDSNGSVAPGTAASQGK